MQRRDDGAKQDRERRHAEEQSRVDAGAARATDGIDDHQRGDDEKQDLAQPLQQRDGTHRATVPTVAISYYLRPSGPRRSPTIGGTGRPAA